MRLFSDRRSDVSVMGTGAGAGVAQAALQAQEVARNRDKERTETIQTASRIREIFETRLRILEESEETPTQLRIEGEVTRHEQPQQQDLDEMGFSADQVPSEADSVPKPLVETQSDATNGEAPLYRLPIIALLMQPPAERLGGFLEAPRGLLGGFLEALRGTCGARHPATAFPHNAAGAGGGRPGGAVSDPHPPSGGGGVETHINI